MKPRVDINNEFRGEEITNGLTNNKAILERGYKILKSKPLDSLKNVLKKD